MMDVLTLQRPAYWHDHGHVHSSMGFTDNPHYHVHQHETGVEPHDGLHIEYAVPGSAHDHYHGYRGAHGGLMSRM